MKSKILPVILLIAISSCKTDPIKNQDHKWPEGVKPPIAEKKPHVRALHGDTVVDNYFWMIDYFKKGPDSTKVVDYLKAENTYLDTMMSGTKAFQKALFKEMKARIKEKDESVPSFKNGYFYYTRTEEGKQYYKYCRKKGVLNATEEILLDVDAMAEGKAYFRLSDIAVSLDNKLIAFGTDEVSRNQFKIQVKNLETGEIYKDLITNTEGDPVWANDNKTFFYTSKNTVTLLSEKIKKHILGNAESLDVTIYEEKDKSNYIGVYKSKDDKHIFLYSSATLSTEYRILDANSPTSDFRVFQPRMKEVLYEITPLEDKFLIVTNWNAKNFRLMECPLNKTTSENWKEVIPHRKDVLLQGVEEFKDHIVISERKEGLIKLRVRNLRDGAEHYLNFGEPAYLAYVSSNPDYNSKVLRYGYTSLTTPNSTFDYDMTTKEKKLLKQQEVVGGYNPADYVTERIYAKSSNDGVKIPISIVYKKSFKKDGENPLLLYGYGSYGASMDATFSSTRLSLLDRGFAFAIAHIRGGQEMGRHWYEDGKRSRGIILINFIRIWLHLQHCCINQIHEV